MRKYYLGVFRHRSLKILIRRWFLYTRYTLYSRFDRLENGVKGRGVAKVDGAYDVIICGKDGGGVYSARPAFGLVRDSFHTLECTADVIGESGDLL